MNRVLITFASARQRSDDYPLAVIVYGADGKQRQETTVRNVRDGRVYANGVCLGGGLADSKVWPVNPELDARLVDVA